MEFKSLKNIETSFKQIRFFGMVFLVVCTAITGIPYGRPTVLQKRSGKRYMYLTGASRSCWLCPKTFRRIVRWKPASMCGDFTNCSLHSPPTRLPSNPISTAPFSWWIRVPISIIRIWRKKGTITGLFRGTLIRLFRSIA
ncbi:hypothetical protein EZS27_021049 [termite gut metagenome]|uniref:Uncharacterized protein n=1 Tax=termite gut metagenome TaxID=433724 RepID=A0A5J4R890_9ZZZZ